MFMVRICITFFILLGFANAANFTYPDFRQCYTKNLKSFVYFGDIRAVAVSKHIAVAYSEVKPKVPFIKYDPFLNLYLFKSKKTLHPVRLKSTNTLKLGEWIAGMDDSSLYAGNFAKSGDVLDSFYLQNAKLEKNSIISCLCCEVYGLGVGAGSFIGSEYIKRFINTKDVYYGDVGARFAKHGKDFVVTKLDPFYPNQLLQVGDKILKINGKKNISLKKLNQSILFAKPKSIVTFEFQRANHILKRSMPVRSRMGGGYRSDSFLEKKGIFFDKNMKITKINKESFGALNGLHVGDKLLQIDKQKIQTSDDVKRYLSQVKNRHVQLLFDRKDFQFFVKLGL